MGLPRPPRRPGSPGRDAVTDFFRDWIEQWHEPDTDWSLEQTGPDTILALVTTRGRGRASGVPVERATRRCGPFAATARPHGALRRPRQGPERGGRRSALPVRVVAGEFKGRRLHAPRGAGTRPTADRVREALFSILGDVSGARVLDLYAGSGALGIEALSRGAESVVFVERDRGALAALRRNLDAVGVDAEIGARTPAFHCPSGRGIRPRFLRPPI